jgi:hypothetical protein
MDEELRRLERTAASGDANAEARLYAERLRRGELTLEGLELAARLGDTAAALVAPPKRPVLDAAFHERHAERLAAIHERALRFLEEGWQPSETSSVLGTLAALAGHEALAERIFALDHVTCNNCDTVFRALG